MSAELATILPHSGPAEKGVSQSRTVAAPRVRNQSQERRMTDPTPSARPPGFHAWIVGLVGVVAILLLLFVLVS